MNASVAIQILPKVIDDEKLIIIVDKVIEYIKSKGLKTVVGPFETTIEGDYDELMEIIKQCQIIAVNSGAPSVMSYVKINYNPLGNMFTISQKIDKYNNLTEGVFLDNYIDKTDETYIPIQYKLDDSPESINDLKPYILLTEFKLKKYLLVLFLKIIF